ncbi:glycosyltransferase [Cellulosimicrobium sp. ES-005]|uniref:Glycosyltransferase n=1 Tax=Cellulosimicrobium sp. ES-005 TaxID=3163031 RepID=A0AAU8G2P1_9MICO
MHADVSAPERGPDVDVVVAVHDVRRPVARAVGSALRNRARVRVTVVCHEIGAHSVAPLLDGLGEGVRVLEHRDGVRSPAGPFNHGLDSATAPFTSVLGSDDVLEPGAVDSWLRTARRDRADVVVARVRHEAGPPMRTPPARPWRRAHLDGVRDRLAYRSAPLGLVSTARFGALRFTPDVEVGEDISYVHALWFSGAAVSLDRGPAYVVMDDTAGRVTRESRPVGTELAYVPRVVRELRDLPQDVRDAVVRKLVRIHVFGAVHNRPDATAWGPDDRTALRKATVELLGAAPRAAAPFSRADRALLDAVLDTTVGADVLVAASVARRRFGRPGTLVPRDVRWSFHREAPLRFMVASALAGRSRPTRGAGAA